MITNSKCEQDIYRLTLENMQDFLNLQSESLLLKLPIDVLIEMMTFLHLDALSSLSLSCKGMFGVHQKDELWCSLFKARFSSITYLFPHRSHKLKCDVRAFQEMKLLTKEKITSNIENGIYRLSEIPHAGVVYGSLIYNDWLILANENAVSIWDFITEKYVHSFEIKTGGISKNLIPLAAHDEKLYCGHTQGCIDVWDLKTFEKIGNFQAHRIKIDSLQIYKGKLFSGASDATIKMWNLETLKHLATFGGHESAVTSMVFYEQKLICSCSYSSHVNIWDIEKKLFLTKLTLRKCCTTRPMLVHKNQLICLDNHGITISDLDSLKQIKEIGDESTKHTGSSLVLYGNKLIAGLQGSPDRIKVWDLISGKYVQKLEGHVSSINSLAIYQGKLISTAVGKDKSVLLWNFLKD